SDVSSVADDVYEPGLWKEPGQLGKVQNVAGCLVSVQRLSGQTGVHREESPYGVREAVRRGGEHRPPDVLSGYPPSREPRTRVEITEESLLGKPIVSPVPVLVPDHPGEKVRLGWNGEFGVRTEDGSHH